MIIDIVPPVCYNVENTTLTKVYQILMILHKKTPQDPETEEAFRETENIGSAPPSAEEELLRRARDGDDDAFGEIVTLYERFVYNTACRILSQNGASVSEAEDVAQSAFFKAWRNLSSFRGECSFTTWLFRITVNCAKDSLRTASRHPTVSMTQEDRDGEETEWDLPETNADLIPEENLEKRERIEGIRRAIDALPQDQRQVLILRDIQELPYTEIARILELELGTVKSRLNRARQNLKNILSDGNFL